MGYVPTPPPPGNVERRKRKATYSLLNTAKDYEKAQRRAQNNNRATYRTLTHRTLGTSSTGPC